MKHSASAILRASILFTAAIHIEPSRRCAAGQPVLCSPDQAPKLNLASLNARPSSEA